MDTKLQDFAEKAVNYASRTGAQYCDARAEQQKQKSVLLENNQTEFVRTNDDRGLGIRIIKDNLWSFCSITNPQSFEEVKVAINNSIKNTNNQNENKIKLYPNTNKKIKINYPVLKKPELDEIIKIGLECNKIILETPKIIKSIVHPWYSINSKYFINSEGTEILQNFTDVIIEMIATAHDSGITQSVNITEGGRGGLEQILNNDKIQKTAKNISSKASQLTNAKPVKEEKATVVMNPDFVSLLTHEILGHPSEADRVLGKEMAWAGGAWWKNKLGEKIGSEKLNVFDDPTIKESLGWYQFDDEGVETRKTTLVENGILKNHMQNRETAQIFNSAPTGNMRATNYRFMPLIRMACTCIANGDSKVDEIIKDVKHGYLISNMKIPSIDMKRYNWSISCQYAQKIENGEITDLLKDVIVMGTAPEFFKSIDACGDDFTVRPITNCGKGDPMQSMIMGNGGPTIRGTATVKSAN
ncbi:TldD/PmbA family protein [Nitrosopumilus cobalaminigenes]|uniref:TldD/PmbA family protein n=1 Tax=Nitrosopumilus cobalaminigenes TaxID=1470066 RepID=A0A7D5LYY1_9ARCH|nr:TldD/PmbA family protein [Nitrosopumilus cobalaminigenes]QLH02633.1 TldD/PmbA family protein [Nitrosopumilus cobalaminigenes]